ncbi:hypothetical protein ABNQ39_14155 [Azospirillum sp. A26]|uniref:hypothetical protein n=1 Tax=Azospirillum sp. A26 TaxID=3160607 RepID=UPI00366C1764
MAGGERRSVTIYYKRLADDANYLGDQTLEQAVREALNRPVEGARIKDLWRARCRANPKDDRENVFINHHQDDGNLLFGDLVCFTQGRAQALLATPGDVDEVDVAQFPPPERHEFLNSMMFWMLIGNHAFIIQSPGLRSEALEVYFSWFLTVKTNVCDHRLQVILADELNVANAGGAGVEDVTSIVIGGRVTGQSLAASDAREVIQPGGVDAVRVRREQRDLAEVTEAGDTGFADRVLKAVYGDQERVNAALRAMPEDATLKVSVKLGYERPKKDLDRSALRNLLIAARNLPDSDLSADTKSGKIKGDVIRLTYGPRVLVIGDLLDRNDVKRAMVEAYRNFIDNGRIEP